MGYFSPYIISIQELFMTTLPGLWKRGADFLGVQHSIMGGAMTWVSESTLVSSISNAGGFGVLACGAMPADILALEIDKTLAKTEKPFGVNLILMHPDLSALIEICAQKNVPFIVLAGGLPSGATLDHIRSHGMKSLAFAPNVILANKLVRMGVDALIIEGSEAGGHIGPVSTSVLAQEILPVIQDVPVFVAGGIGRGEAIVEYLRMGASGVQLGTRFVCAHECTAHPHFKKAFINAKARDAVASYQVDPRFPVIPVRALANKATEDFLNKQRDVIQEVNAGHMDMKAGQLAIEHFWAGALRRAVVEGDVDTGSLMAGQSVGMVTCEQSTQEILDELIAQAEAYLAHTS